MILTKDALLKRKTEKATISAGDIYIRQLTLAERDRFLDKYAKDDISKKEWRQAFICLCLCDEQSKPLFDSTQQDEINSISAELATEILNACLTVNGLNETAKDDAKKN